MKIKQLIVDGSNIATEGRSLPSLKQLDEAVRAFLDDSDVDNVAVIVDATFGHRIDKSEVAEFDTAVANNEITTPPAGVIGRGDAFILQVADKAGAVVLSNDSFQEFHPQYKWLFEEGRLIGGKPVPGIGWVFAPRVPVRGPVSRRATKAASSRQSNALTSKKTAKRGDSGPSGGGGRKAEKGRGGRSEQGRGRRAEPAAPKAKSGSDRNRKRSAAAAGPPLNDPLPFIQFVSDHHVADVVEGTVETFSSHGAYVRVDAALCYVPLRAMATPAPRRARDVLTIGEVREFIVEAIDTPRRGIDLSLRAGGARRDAVDERDASGSRDARVTNKGATLVDENEGGFARERTEAARKARSRATKANTDAPQAVTKDGADHHAEEAPVAPVKKAAKKTARKATKKAPAKRAVKRPAKKAVRKTAKKAAKRPAKKTAKKAAKKAPAKRAAKKTAKKATKKAAKRPAKKAAKRPVKKAAKKRPAKKAARRR